MAEVAHTRAYHITMLSSNGENQSAVERSRATRRRRIELRRNSGAFAAANGHVLPSRQGDGVLEFDERWEPEGSIVSIPMPTTCFSWAPRNGAPVIGESMPRVVPSVAVGGLLRTPSLRRIPVPVVGAIAVAGRQRQMEDAISIKTNLCLPMINRCRPVHYFGIFDGHGGSHFAITCKEKMHEILKEELIGVSVAQNPIGCNHRPPLPPPGIITDESVQQEAWRIVMSRVFSRTEMVALHTCSCGSVGFRCRCERNSVSFSGTTAAVVVLTEKHIVAANCGDSRAILYRGGRIIPLTFDHKPERADEKARIQASGGRVINTDTPRVQGILAMSRAIGDMYLKPYVISEPEVTFTRRDEEDEFLIIASDGMWDVMPMDMAGRVVRECLKEPCGTVAATGGSQDLNFEQLENEGSSNMFPSRSALAASLLTRLALARRSVDNISVVVVDLKRDVRVTTIVV